MPWIGHNYGVVFVARLIQGPVAISFCTVGPILALWFPPRERGLAGGLLMCMMSLGPTVVYLTGYPIFEATGTWQKTIAVFSIPGWVSMVLALLFTRRKPPQVAMAEGPAAPASGGETYKQILRLPITWIGTLVFFCNAWGFYTLLNVVPPYLGLPVPMGLGLAPMTAGKLSLLLGAIGIPAFVLGGIFFDKVAKGRSRPAIWMGYVISGVGAYLILLPFIHNNMILLAIAIMAAGFGMTFMGSSITAFIPMNYPPYLAGSMVGFWFGIGTLGGALGIYLTGLTTALTGSFTWGFNLIALAAALGVVITFALKPRAR
jgi:nitrate/nitrite transporter NarK